MDTTKVRKNIKGYYRQLYTSKLDNKMKTFILKQDKMKTFSETKNLLKLNQEETEKSA